MASKGDGSVRPRDIRQFWTESDLIEIVALNEIKNAEFELGDNAETEERRKTLSMKTKQLHKKMLRELNTKTFAHVKGIPTSKNQKSPREIMREAARLHNENINK